MAKVSIMDHRETLPMARLTEQTKLYYYNYRSTHSRTIKSVMHIEKKHTSLYPCLHVNMNSPIDVANFLLRADRHRSTMITATSTRRTKSTITTAAPPAMMIGSIGTDSGSNLAPEGSVDVSTCLPGLGRGVAAAVECCTMWRRDTIIVVRFGHDAKAGKESPCIA